MINEMLGVNQNYIVFYWTTILHIMCKCIFTSVLQTDTYLLNTSSDRLYTVSRLQFLAMASRHNRKLCLQWHYCSGFLRFSI